MLEVADIFRQYGEEYLRKFAKNMPPSHRRAFEDILDCRTEVMGGHLYICDHCGRQHYAYHSCRNRSCPKCHGRDVHGWLEDRHKELLPVEYFHVVFTLPRELHSLIRSHQRTLYGMLMKAAAESLMQLAADPQYVGGRVGLMSVLHTWTRTLAYHPHVHCLIPGGGVSSDGQWLPARKGFLVPVKALSKLFRGKFMARIDRKLPDAKLPQAVWNKDWVIYCKPTVQGAEKVLHYLGRYIYRIAITNSRLLSIDDGKVTFRYQDCGQSQWKTMTLKAEEFIRRFLQHVLPKGVHKVRYYGLWGPSNRRLLHRVQTALGTKRSDEPSSTLGDGEPDRDDAVCTGKPCRHCGKGMLVWASRVPRQRQRKIRSLTQSRAPPKKTEPSGKKRSRYDGPIPQPALSA